MLHYKTTQIVGSNKETYQGISSKIQIQKEIQIQTQIQIQVLSSGISFCHLLYLPPHHCPHHQT